MRSEAGYPLVHAGANEQSLRRSPQQTYRWGRIALVVLALVGVAWRLRNFLQAKSVWLDEVSLATEIERRSLYELVTAPLGRYQVAPPGYLFFSKWVMSFGVVDEFTLRILPCVGAALGVFLGWRFARVAERLSMPARGVFLGLLAVSPVLGLYAAEAKQYGLDAVATLGLLLLVSGEGPLAERWKQLALGGAIAVWFSHPAVFTLGAIGIAIVLDRENMRTPGRWLRCVLLFSAWLAACGVAFGPLYLAGGPNERLHYYWVTGFAPRWPTSWEELSWYPESLLHLMEVAFGPATRYGISPRSPEFLVPGSGFLYLATVGWLTLRSVWPRLAVISAAMLLGALAASLLGVYPFRGRLLLYILPIIFLNVGAYFHAWRRWRGVPTIIAGGFIAVALGGEVMSGWVQPFHSPEARPVMECLGRLRRSEDRLYPLPLSARTLGFYRKRFGIERRFIKSLRWKPLGPAGSISLAARVSNILAGAATRVWIVGLHNPGIYFDELSRSTVAQNIVARCSGRDAEAWLLVPPSLDVFDHAHSRLEK